MLGLLATAGVEAGPFWRGQTEVLPSTAVANTIEPLIAMSEQGPGIACLPDNALRSQLRDGTLRTVLDHYVEHNGPFRLLWPSSRYPSPKLHAFVQFMAKNLFATSGLDSAAADDGRSIL